MNNSKQREFRKHIYKLGCLNELAEKGFEFEFEDVEGTWGKRKDALLYQITFDETLVSWLAWVSFSNQPLVRGKGGSVTEAMEDLEEHLTKTTRRFCAAKEWVCIPEAEGLVADETKIIRNIRRK